jgi:hypothetical protein
MYILTWPKITASTYLKKFSLTDDLKLLMKEQVESPRINSKVGCWDIKSI